MHSLSRSSGLHWTFLLSLCDGLNATSPFIFPENPDHTRVLPCCGYFLTQSVCRTATTRSTEARECLCHGSSVMGYRMKKRWIEECVRRGWITPPRAEADKTFWNVLTFIFKQKLNWWFLYSTKHKRFAQYLITSTLFYV